MSDKANRSPDGAKAILEHNLQILYHIPNRYQNLTRALKNVRKDLLAIYKYIKGIDPIIWKQKYVWYIDNRHLTYKIRKSQSEAQSNRIFNYLSCIGVLEKQKQIGDDMIGINKEFMLETGRERAINVFTVYRYTPKKLDELERRSAELLEHGITPGNISRDKLVISGLPRLAKKIYYSNKEEPLQRKEKEFERIIACMRNQCQKNGYTTKKELCIFLGIKSSKLDELLKLFRSTWQTEFVYKPPSRAEKEQYKIITKKFIFRRR